MLRASCHVRLTFRRARRRNAPCGLLRTQKADERFDGGDTEDIDHDLCARTKRVLSEVANCMRGLGGGTL